MFIVATSSFVMNMVHGFNIGKRRKQAGITYPQHYATEAQVAEKQEGMSPLHYNLPPTRSPCPSQPGPRYETNNSLPAFLYNCAQRAHGNYIENQPSFLAAMLLSGLQFPLTAASLGAVWIVSRYVYMIGYQNPAWGKNGKGRLRGAGYALAQMALIGLTAFSGYKMITA